MAPPPQSLDPPEGEQPTQVEMEALRRVFQWLDADRDGKLSFQEIHSALAKLNYKLGKVGGG